MDFKDVNGVLTAFDYIGGGEDSDIGVFVLFQGWGDDGEHFYFKSEPGVPLSHRQCRQLAAKLAELNVEIGDSSTVETKEAPKRERLPPRPVDQRSTPDMTIRCALCDRGFLPGEVFSFPRECCEEGKKRDIEFNDYSTSTNR